MSASIKVNSANPYPLRNEVDRFGFSWLVANSLGINGDPPKALCSWVHGWKWYDILDYKFLAPAHPAIRHRTIVVTNKKQKNELANFGFNKVIVGGLPFAYSFAPQFQLDNNIVNIPKLPKERDIIVLLPKCGYDGGRSLVSFNAVLDYVRSSHELYMRSVLCVFGGDYKIDEVKVALIKSKIPFISGSDPYSRVDLIRTRMIFRKFRYAVTNTIGSHIPYLTACGVKVKLIEPFNNRDYTSFMLSKTIRTFGREYISYLEEVNSKQYFIDRYGDIINFDKFSNDLTDWGLNEIGYNNILDKDEIETIFGWNFPSRINSMIEALKFRVLSKL